MLLRKAILQVGIEKDPFKMIESHEQFTTVKLKRTTETFVDWTVVS
jgi:hypothetical protein